MVGFHEWLYQEEPGEIDLFRRKTSISTPEDSQRQNTNSGIILPNLDAVTFSVANWQDMPCRLLVMHRRQIKSDPKNTSEESTSHPLGSPPRASASFRVHS